MIGWVSLVKLGLRTPKRSSAITLPSFGRLPRAISSTIAVRGRPAMIVSDNDTELTSMAMLRWAGLADRVTPHCAR
jgi:hypothetical protein